MSDLVPYAPKNGVDLITPAHFRRLPKGTRLLCFDDRNVYVKGRDEISLDTRGGFIAFGFPTRSSDNKPYEGPFRTK